MHEVAEEIWRKDAARIVRERVTELMNPPNVKKGERIKSVCTGEKPYDAEELLGRLGKLNWTLKSLTADIKQLRFSFSSAEQTHNVRLAVAHLEDALHRINLVLE